MSACQVSFEITSDELDEEQEIQDEAEKKKQKVNVHERQIRYGLVASKASKANLGFPNYFIA